MHRLCTRGVLGLLVPDRQRHHEYHKKVHHVVGHLVVTLRHRTLPHVLVLDRARRLVVLARRRAAQNHLRRVLQSSKDLLLPGSDRLIAIIASVVALAALGEPPRAALLEQLIGQPRVVLESLVNGRAKPEDSVLHAIHRGVLVERLVARFVQFLQEILVTRGRVPVTKRRASHQDNVVVVLERRELHSGIVALHRVRDLKLEAVLFHPLGRDALDSTFGRARLGAIHDEHPLGSHGCSL
mmetsp:Transcript_17716/g.41562  ORF Transcript_17716/g.41562 Transcript_17716/m.41562 type:complete len:240 (-) Transcript_17716:137-856(-)